jgi:hypothetical protein
MVDLWSTSIAVEIVAMISGTNDMISCTLLVGKEKW